MGQADLKGRRPACGCWLGLELDAHTAAQTCPGSQKGAQERVRFSACKLHPNRTTRKLPSRHSRHPGWVQAGHPARKPATAEQGPSVRPLVPALGTELLLLGRLGGLLGRRWLGCQAGGNGPQWPASQFLVPPRAGREGYLGERRWSSSGDMPSSCKSRTLGFHQIGRQTTPEESRCREGWAELGWGLKATQLLGFLSDQMVEKLIGS